MFLCNVCCSEKYDKVEKTRTDKDERKDKSKDSQVLELCFSSLKVLRLVIIRRGAAHPLCRVPRSTATPVML